MERPDRITVTWRAPCVCGCERPPRAVRRYSKSMLWNAECPCCLRRTPGDRPENLDARWNDMQEQLRRDGAGA